MAQQKHLRSITVSSISEVNDIELRLNLSVQEGMSSISRILKEHDPLHSLAKIKFEQVGRDPLDHNRPLNFIEQVNQTFTYLATLRGVKYLLEHHPQSSPFLINLGTANGADIESEDKSISAEVFAATSPTSNNKLNKDIEKVDSTQALYKYVFYYSPISHKEVSNIGKVKVIRVELFG